MFGSPRQEQKEGFDKDSIMEMLQSSGLMESRNNVANFFNAEEGEMETEDVEFVPEDELPIVEARIPEVPKKQETVNTPEKTEEKVNYSFSPAEIQQAKLHLIKPKANWKREYKITEGFSVWLEPISDKTEGMLNDYMSRVVSRGDKRTRVDVVDAYYDEVNQIQVPGGRTEVEFFYNADAARAAKRAEMSGYIHTIGDDVLHKLSIEDRLTILEDYTPQILEIIYDKAFFPFYSLILEAKRQIRKE